MAKSTRNATVIAGIDFGTWSTKVMARERSVNQEKLLSIGHARDHEQNSYVWFVTPSLLRLMPNGTLRFGRDALREEAGVRIPSPKTTLCTGRISARELDDLLPDDLSCDVLMALYVSRILKLIRKAAFEFYGDNTQIMLNGAAPTTRFGDDSVRNRCLRIFHAAYQSVFSTNPVEVRQGSRLSDLRDDFERWLHEALPSLDERKYEVLPETLAPVTSLLQRPDIETDRIYIVIDIGGGTTEMSVNYVTRDRNVDCYDDQILPINTQSLQVGSDGEPPQEVMSRLLTAVRRMVVTAFQKHAAGRRLETDRWRELTIVLSGGGCVIPELSQQLEKMFPVTGHPLGENECIVITSRPVRHLNSQPVPSLIAPILTCIHGLSLPRQKWPKFELPEQLTGISGPDERLDRGPAFHERDW